MRAPVYRGIDSGSTLLGLAFPGEVLVVLLAYWSAIYAAGPSVALLVSLGTYGVLRLGSVGKPPQHLQNSLLFHARRASAGGHFSAATRVSQSQRFPFATYDCRDVRRVAP